MKKQHGSRAWGRGFQMIKGGEETTPNFKVTATLVNLNGWL
jgi:hypothetical protein